MKTPPLSFEQIRGNIRIPQNKRSISITDDEAAALYNFLISHNWKGKRTVEIGFAYGYSAAIIAGATGALHTVIDPFQKKYGNMGIRNMKALGLWKNTTLIAGYSHWALPLLLKKKRVFDFAFIDGGHLFDGIFLDFYYLEKLLSPGGFLLFHDASLPQTRMVLGWIASNRPDFRFLQVSQPNLCIVQRISNDKRPWWDYHHFNLYGLSRFNKLKQLIRRIIGKI